MEGCSTASDLQLQNKTPVSIVTDTCITVYCRVKKCYSIILRDKQQSLNDIIDTIESIALE